MFNELRNRELKISEIFSLSAKIFRGNLIPILFITVLIFFPISIILNIITNQIEQSINVLHGAMAINSKGFLLTNEIKRLGIYMLVMEIILVFLEPLGVIAVAKGTEKRICGEEVHYGEMILHALGNGPSIILVGILHTLFIGVASFLFFPAIYLWIIWCFYLYAIGLRDKTGLDALRYSHSLVRGRWWYTFGIFALLIVLEFICSYGIGTICMAGTGIFFLDTLSSVLSYIVRAFVIIFITILFINRSYLVEKDNENGNGNGPINREVRIKNPWDNWENLGEENTDLKQDRFEEQSSLSKDDPNHEDRL